MRFERKNGSTLDVSDHLDIEGELEITIEGDRYQDERSFWLSPQAMRALVEHIEKLEADAARRSSSAGAEEGGDRG